MRKTTGVFGLIIAAMVLVSWMATPEEQSYKCMVQLTNYQGEGAYMIVSLVNEENQYEETLYVMGEDEEWYPDMKKWWAFFEPNPTELDGITGATISGGERMVCVLNLDASKLNAGYKIRFETAVENQDYFVDDLLVPYEDGKVAGKFEGTGYIRYVRILAN